MSDRRRETFVATRKDYTPETVPAAPVVAAAFAVVVLLVIVAGLAVGAVVVSL